MAESINLRSQRCLHPIIMIKQESMTKQPVYIGLDQNWVSSIKLNHQLIACRRCMKIPVGVNNQVQCASCKSLYCQQDFEAITEQDGKCLVCRNTLNRQELHLTYKQIFCSSSFVCRDCPPSNIHHSNHNYSHVELAQHISNSHEVNGSVKQKIMGLCEFVLTDQNDSNYELTLLDQVILNHCQLKNQHNCCIMGPVDVPLTIDLHKNIAYLGKHNKMQITRTVNTAIKVKMSYTIWSYRSGDTQIYFDGKSQELISQGMKQFVSNNKLNELLIQKENMLLRIQFQKNKIVNVSNQEKYHLQSKQCMFR